MDNYKKVKVLFLIRIALWVVALVATVYWIYWSFHLYTLGYMDESVYATALRPIMAKGIIIASIAIIISVCLRKKSDTLKEIERKKLY